MHTTVMHRISYTCVCVYIDSLAAFLSTKDLINFSIQISDVWKTGGFNDSCVCK